MSATPAAFLEDLKAEFAVTTEHKEFYRDNGYIKLKQVLSPDTLEYYGKIITDQVLLNNQETVPLEQRDTYGKAFLQIMNLWTKDDFVKEFVFSPKLAHIAAELMGCRGVRLYHDQALYKEPSGGHTPWHADQFYWPVGGDNTVTVWVPLQTTPLEMGPLAFAPQSHRVKAGRDLGISDDSEKFIDKTVKETTKALDETPFDLGEVSYHAGWTFHRAGPNKSDKPRRVMTVIYLEQDIRLITPQRKEHLNDWNTWMPGAEVGEIVNSPLNPVLWTQPA